MLDLTGKRIFVLGGETTLGRAVAIALAGAGADVAIVALTAETKAEFAVNSALNQLWAIGRQGIALAIDASDPTAVRDAVARAGRELGALAAAAVAAPEGALPALDALRDALGDCPLLVFPTGANAQAVVDEISAVASGRE